MREEIGGGNTKWRQNSFHLGSNLRNRNDVDEMRSCAASMHGFTWVTYDNTRSVSHHKNSTEKKINFYLFEILLRCVHLRSNSQIATVLIRWEAVPRGCAVLDELLVINRDQFHTTRSRGKYAYRAYRSVTFSCYNASYMTYGKKINFIMNVNCLPGSLLNTSSCNSILAYFLNAKQSACHI